MKNSFRSSLLLPIFAIGFFATLHTTIPVYFNAIVIGETVGSKLVGSIYSLASLITLVGFIYLPTLLHRFGNYRIGFTILFLEAFSIICIAYSNTPILKIGGLITYLFLAPLIGFVIDVFLERNTKNGSTGSVRGAFLTTVNLAWVISPIIGGAFLVASEKTLYLSALLVLIPVFFLLPKLEKFKDPEYKHPSLRDSLKWLRNHSDVRKISIIFFILQFFFAIMVIYLPLYLGQIVKMDPSAIGIVFTIMLIPFILVEAPLGFIADHRFGEKEIMSLGFGITALFTAILPFIESTNLALWAIILFCSRLGAAAIEITSESYFFKKVHAKDASLVSLFRMTRPLAYIVAPIVATLIFFISNTSYGVLFFTLAILLGIGTATALSLNDTR